MRKSDDEDISAFLDQLATEPWLDQAQRVWPHYLFHVTDARNVPSITVAQKLLCRSTAVESHVLCVDSASSEIIAQTSVQYRNEVRLYFRPRAPTFYRNEGIRPPGTRYMDAHCPMPVVLLFDSKHVLGARDTRFSDGSLASGRAQVGEDVHFLRRMPFNLIYHDRYFHPDERDEIIFRRQAEVIVPQELSLATLRYVCVRSVAEFETLESLLRDEPRLADQALKRLLGLVRVNSKALLFHKQWTFVERVDRMGDYLRIRFNPSTRTPGPFTAVFSWRAEGQSLEIQVTNHYFLAKEPHLEMIPRSLRDRAFRFSLRLDDSLAYLGSFTSPSDHELLEAPF